MKHFVKKEKHHFGVWGFALLVAIITGILLMIR